MNRRLAVVLALIVTGLVVAAAGLMMLQSKSGNPSSELPVVSFTYVHENPETSLNVTFNASESYDPDGLIVDYSWSFGDGTTGNGMIIKHQFITAGYHETVLTVTDDKGDKNHTSKEIVVNIRAHCEWEEVSASGFTVVLSGAGSYDPDGGNLEYEWAVIRQSESVINDTEIYHSFGVEFNYTFDAPGTYLVYFGVTDDEGFTASTFISYVVPID